MVYKMNKLGTFIEQSRVEKGLSQRELAELSDISHSYLNSIEKGISPQSGKPVSPTIETLEKIAQGLNISLEELLFQAGYISGTQYLTSHLRYDHLDLDKLDNRPLSLEEIELIKFYRDTPLTPEENKGLRALIKAYLQCLKEK
jgi:transcriptional regulator with XRE-family HTH domain